MRYYIKSVTLLYTHKTLFTTSIMILKNVSSRELIYHPKAKTKEWCILLVFCSYCVYVIQHSLISEIDFKKLTNDGCMTSKLNI